MTKKVTDKGNKHKNKKKYTKNTICVIICSILLFIALGFLLYRWSRPFYKVESRVDAVKKKDKEVSRDVTGWVRVQGTDIDYPIIYSAGEEVKGDYSFAWSNQKESFVAERKVLLGHNILNLSSTPMTTNEKFSGFEELLSFLYPKFIKNNKYIQYTVDGEDYIYKIFAISFVNTDDGDINTYYMDKDAKKKYIKQVKKDSYFDFDVDVDSNDGIITLATCTRFFGPKAGYSFRIDGRLVRNGEILLNYGFKEKENYNKIKKILKGDETSEKA